jgi:peptidyl-tRNA hydrolase, PTH1 family
LSAETRQTRLIVGLGNPGTEYEWTPHNLGFLAIDELGRRSGIRVTRPEAKSQIGRGELVGQEVILAKPQTMMNLSGVAVRMLLEKYESDPSQLIAISDEVALPWGMLRIRERGSAGGHNGLKSVIDAVGTDEFIRVRLGVGPEKVWGDLADYVLCPMGRAEREVATQLAEDASKAVEAILRDGVSTAMSQFNRRVSPEEDDSE